MDISQSRRLISLYKEYKCLWDPKDINYTNRGVREDAWRQISREMENKPIEDLKKKMRCLTGGFRREKFREKQSRITGSGSYRRERSREKRSQRVIADSRKHYKSNWYAYNAFQFMRDKDPAIYYRREGEPKSDGTTQIQEEPKNEHEEQLFDTTKTVPKKRKTQKVSKLISPTISTSTGTTTEDEFDLFGRSMAYQLKRLPEFTALELMQTMQEIVIKKRKEINTKNSIATSKNVNTWEADLSENDTVIFEVGADNCEESLVEADDYDRLDPLQAKRFKIETENNSSE